MRSKIPVSYLSILDSWYALVLPLLISALKYSDRNPSMYVFKNRNHKRGTPYDDSSKRTNEGNQFNLNFKNWQYNLPQQRIL